MRWKSDFAAGQSLDEVLEEALPEDDGDGGGVGDSGADTDDDVGGPKMSTPQTTHVHRRRKRSLGPRWR